MDAAYAEAYPQLYRQHWWWRVREGILIAKLQQLFQRRTATARILDVGCGAGLFFDALERFGHVQGIESDSLSAARSGRWATSITVGQLDDRYTPSEPFDLILMLDLLEHLDEPVAPLRRASEILGPTGLILITVPAFNWLWTEHDEMNHHVRRYTREEIRGLIGDAGLTIVDVGFMFQSLVVAKLWVRMKEAIVGPHHRVPRVPWRWLNRGLQTWYRIEYAIAGRFPFGGSLMVVVGHRK